MVADSPNLQRQTLHRHLCGETSYNNNPTHDAVRDVKQLKDIITHDEFPFCEFNEYIVATITSQALNPDVQQESSHGQLIKNDSDGIKHEHKSPQC